MPKVIKSIFKNKIVLITGGTGSFGKAFVHELLDHHSPRAVRILSRDELKQWEMAESLRNHPKFLLLRFFLGDVRDVNRLCQAFEDVDIVVHAAALKQVPAAEYNPFECIKTNILGAQNVIEASLNSHVQKVIALSTDKASSPVNLYGATKLCSDKLFIAANNMKGKRKIAFSVVRYGNVMGSRGSVIPFFLQRRHSGKLPITHLEMTRFNITLPEACQFVIKALINMVGGEIFIPKLPSYHVQDLAEAISPKSEKVFVGLRPGEKIHEEMIPSPEAGNTIEFKHHFIVVPPNSAWLKPAVYKKKSGKTVPAGFSYNSGSNTLWLDIKTIRQLIKSEIDGEFEPN